MDVGQVERMLAWGAAINYVILLVWFGIFALGHDWLYNLHVRWFKLPAACFDAVHYAGMAIYKIGILLFFLVPLLALSATH